MLLFICNYSYGQENTNFIHLDKTFKFDSQIVEDYLGYIWISDNEGLYKYNGYNYSFTPYKTIFGDDFTTDEEFLFIKDIHQNFWLSSLKGELTKISKESVYTSYKDSLTFNKKQIQITSISSDKEGPWFDSVNGVVYRYNDQNFKIDSIISLPKVKGLHQRIKGIITKNANSIWNSTNRSKIYKYNFKKSELKEIKNSIDGYTQDIRIVTDKKGVLRICTEFNGLLNYDEKRMIQLRVLIIKNGYNISEATFMVGYKDPKYITKSFKKEFGKTPNNLKKEAKEIGLLEMQKKYNW